MKTKTLTTTQKYDVVYIVDGEVKETIDFNLPIALAKWKKNQAMMSGLYKSGIILLRRKENSSK